MEAQDLSNTNDFLVALISMGAVLRKEKETIIASGLDLKEDDLGTMICKGRSYVRPKYYGLYAVQLGKEIHFTSNSAPD